jgi:hypothetical protein
MTTSTTSAFESLSGALDRVYQSLTGDGQDCAAPDGEPVRSEERWHALEQLTALFRLSPFERDLLVLCAGHALQSRFAPACQTAAGGAHAAWPTFGLALAVLDSPHWSAVTAAGPLRYWQLITVDRGSLLQAPVHIDERILAFLIGVPAIDERLTALARPVLTAPAPPDAAVRAGARHWARSPAPREPLLLVGTDASARQGAFSSICQVSGLAPYFIDATDLPAAAPDRQALARLWTREAALSGAALCLRTEECDNVRNVAAWLEHTEAPLAIEVRPGTPAERLDGLRLHVPCLSAGERRDAWVRDLGPLAQHMNGYLDRIAEHFHFDEAAIRLSAAAVRDVAEDTTADDTELGQAAWRVCRQHARRSLDTLARRVEARACWDDLVLPAAQMETLQQIAIHVRRRAVVNDQWGFAAKHARGVGMTALFSGGSGTGKTMAAEILAAELDLDLYQIDLASVVSKWLGETEKNLRAIFEGAQQSGAILLFDEADALFGKRSDVRDSHDRYANLEISYLLQQMESYRGVAILTTNMGHALDPAFMRRIRFVIRFPFPDAAARAGIWQRVFPATTPVGELDFGQLAQLNVTGAVIRNIAMHAAFLAADDSMRVDARHILAAARIEYAKLDKPLTAAETRGFR